MTSSLFLFPLPHFFSDKSSEESSPAGLLYYGYATASRFFFFPFFLCCYFKVRDLKEEETMMVRASFRIQDSENLGVVC